MAFKIYTYETKCRRCDNICVQYFTNVKFNHNSFLETITERVREPRLYICQHCNKETIQDVVSYSKSEA